MAWYGKVSCMCDEDYHHVFSRQRCLWVESRLFAAGNSRVPGGKTCCWDSDYWFPVLLIRSSLSYLPNCWTKPLSWCIWIPVELWSRAKLHYITSWSSICEIKYPGLHWWWLLTFTLAWPILMHVWTSGSSCKALKWQDSHVSHVGTASVAVRLGKGLLPSHEIMTFCYEAGAQPLKVCLKKGTCAQNVQQNRFANVATPQVNAPSVNAGIALCSWVFPSRCICEGKYKNNWRHPQKSCTSWLHVTAVHLCILKIMMPSWDCSRRLCIALLPPATHPPSRVTPSESGLQLMHVLNQVETAAEADHQQQRTFAYAEAATCKCRYTKIRVVMCAYNQGVFGDWILRTPSST